MVAVAQSAERQVVALEVAGSSPVGHPPIQHKDALEPENIRRQGIWRFQRDGVSPYSLPLRPDLRRSVALSGNHTSHKRRKVSSSARDC
jgi:hypothetical protein